jgi:hypothetical protein
VHLAKRKSAAPSNSSFGTSCIMSSPNVQSTKFSSFCVSSIGTTRIHVAYCTKSSPNLTNSAMETYLCSPCLPMTCSVTTPNSPLLSSTRCWRTSDVALSRIYIARTSEDSRRSSIWANSTSTALLARDLFSTRCGRSSPLGIVSGVYVQLYLATLTRFSSAKGPPSTAVSVLDRYAG